MGQAWAESPFSWIEMYNPHHALYLSLPAMQLLLHLHALPLERHRLAHAERARGVVDRGGVQRPHAHAAVLEVAAGGVHQLCPRPCGEIASPPI
jgi:hypothetical protein